ncbi:MAG: alpha/beta hydrolase [Crocosphaera sp.]
MNATIAPIPLVEDDSSQGVDDKKITEKISDSNIKRYFAISNSSINVEDSSSSSEEPRFILRDWKEFSEFSNLGKLRCDKYNSRCFKNRQFLSIKNFQLFLIYIRCLLKAKYKSVEVDNKKIVADIASFLSTPKNKDEKCNELVIMIHGYKTEKKTAIQEYDNRFNFIKDHCNNFNLNNNRKLVIIGYTWPSEDFLKDGFKSFSKFCCTALKTLPISLEYLFNLLCFFGFIILILMTFNIYHCPEYQCSYIIPYLHEPLIKIGVYIIRFFCTIFMSYNLMFILGIFNIDNFKERCSMINIIFNNLTILIYLLLIVGVWFIFDIVMYKVQFSLENSLYWLMGGWLIIFLIYLGMVITFIGLRVTNYFRDKYRAMFFGVADLVDLIENLDSQLKRDVKLSFIAHSMGAFVTTHTIRTLYNAFGNGQTNNYKNTNTGTRIGDHFLLGRLVLVAPDISIQAIFPGKSNVLGTAIDKCEEAYLFSNQGDMILRVFSMISNYFRFPAKSTERGFRLGNIIVYDEKQRNQCYQTLNLDGKMDKTKFLSNLHIVCRGERKSLFELLGSPKFKPTDSLITTQVSYFDCTDSRDHIRNNNDNNNNWSEPKPILSRAKNHQIIRVMQCLELLRQWLFNNHDSKIDIHGGYFNGKFCQTLIYGLACLGLDDVKAFWKEFYKQDKYFQNSANNLLEECQRRHIQVLLSTPERSICVSEKPNQN